MTHKITETHHTTTIVLNENAKQLTKKLALPVIANDSTEYDFMLFYDEKNQLSLKSPTLGVICVDFVQGKLGYRRRFVETEKIIKKAFGFKKLLDFNVLDATAGLARDAFILASLGYQVTLIEQSPILAALIEDALDLGRKSEAIAEAISRMHLIQTDSIAHMQQLPDDKRPDIIYLDPMFPTSKKSALAKKEMQMLQALLETNETKNNDLLKTSLQCAKNRVVVKRNRFAPPLNNQNPNIFFYGNTVRFDVYLV